ncbi:MAG: dihydrofolate reductase [Ignavibacteria bacterium]|nr:dihydrofolate reductase [Ignavibacteria bacterium]
MSYSFSLEAILAIGLNDAIGNRGTLPWHIPSELRLFKSITEGHTLIMGKNTFASLPSLLSNRHHIILSNTMPVTDGVHIVPSMSAALKKADELHSEKVLLIGGVSVFHEALHECSVIHVSRVMLAPEADTFYAFNPLHHRIDESVCFRDPSTHVDIIYQKYKRII